MYFVLSALMVELVDNARQIYAADALADKIARCIFVGPLRVYYF